MSIWRTMRIFVVKAGECDLYLTKNGKRQIRNAVEFLDELESPLETRSTLLTMLATPAATSSANLIRTGMQIKFSETVSNLHKKDFTPVRVALFSPAMRDVIVVSDSPEMEDFLAQYAPKDSEKYEAGNGDIFLIISGQKPQKIFSQS